MGRFLRRGIFFTLLFACGVTPAAADPVLMFLLSMAREIIEAHSSRPRPAPAPQLPTQFPNMALVYPGTSVEPEHLRRLIDDCFAYLGESQRGEIFASLHGALKDPKNAAIRGPMIDYFADRALTVREAQRRLAQLSSREKELIAGEFRKELAALSVDEQAELGELLRKGLLPVPSDLNQLLLATFESR